MDALKLLAEDWGALRYFAGFLVLPLVYLRESAEVHKEYTQAVRELRERSADRSVLVAELRVLRQHVEMFRLEWWLVGAITALLTSVFLLGEVVSASQLLECASDQSREAGLSECVVAEGLVSGFGFALALGAIFLVQWFKTEALRALHDSVNRVASILLEDSPRGG